MPNKNSIRTASKLVVEVTTDRDDIVTDKPSVTLWVTTQQDRCIAALSLSPREAEKVGAMLVAGAMEVAQ